jgi:hypothetical protein
MNCLEVSNYRYIIRGFILFYSTQGGCHDKKMGFCVHDGCHLSKWCIFINRIQGNYEI